MEINVDELQSSREMSGSIPDFMTWPKPSWARRQRTPNRNREPSQVTSKAVEDIFSRPPVYEVIFSDLSPGALIRFGHTCRLARNAVAIFSSHAFNINRHLSRFFSDPIGFRSLQARTATVISGSNALQFLDRTFYPESDLDLYAHPGHTQEVGQWLIQKEGYTFLPKEDQIHAFDGPDWPNPWKPWLSTMPRTDVDWEAMHVERYRVAGLDTIHHFEKRTSDDPEESALKVQIMTAEVNPMQCILAFHSTCVMNFITFDAAYSLYPRATFEDRRALSFSALNDNDIRALGKYSLRGWSILANIWPHEIRKLRASFYMDEDRFVNDGYSWVVPLDTTGVSPRMRSSPTSQPFPWDPILHNSWKVVKLSIFSKMFMSYHILKPTLFRYAYLVADLDLINHMTMFLCEQGGLEHKKAAHLSEEQKQASWTWWDAILPGFIEEYNDKKRRRG